MAAAKTCGLLVHGTRRLLPGRVGVYKTDFEAWTARNGKGLNAAFAFPDPSDAELMHTLIWAKGDLRGAGPRSEAFASTVEDRDTLAVYGSGTVTSTDSGVRCESHVPLAGFIRSGQEHPGAAGAPMIGVFQRALKPGRLDELARTFQVVCDIWHATVPGILAATVSRDVADANVVHDVRIFADAASYAAHVDKSNAELTMAMEEWFEHYDTSVPHRGALYAEDTRDPSLRTSSIKDTPVKVAFNTFHYGDGGMIGDAPSLTPGA